MMNTKKPSARISYTILRGESVVTVCQVFVGGKIVASGQAMCKSERFIEDIGKKMAFSSAMKGWFRRQYIVTESVDNQREPNAHA